VKIIATPIQNLFVIELEPFEDKRGKFVRIFCQRELQKAGLIEHISQINCSLTRTKGCVRGMHFQYPPKAEIKIVRCLRGAIFDVAIDLRKDSPTFLQWYGETLTGNSMKMMYIPPGFAHGFQALEGSSEVLYLHTEYYSPGHEDGVRYDDPLVGIRWPCQVTDVSDRDRNHPPLTADFQGIEA
jgi:dTDP-4-dehydrorhamnose 3,5-epimerase